MKLIRLLGQIYKKKEKKREYYCSERIKGAIYSPTFLIIYKDIKNLTLPIKFQQFILFST